MSLPEGLVVCEDGLVRPTWAASDPLLRDYYDTEWGSPVTSEQGVFERLVLESFQSGLSWSTILKKREAFRTAFASFIPELNRVRTFARMIEANDREEGSFVRLTCPAWRRVSTSCLVKPVIAVSGVLVVTRASSWSCGGESE